MTSNQAADALALVRGFSASAEEEKSRELILALLSETPAPFSRDQFEPGHITCSTVVLHPDRQRILLMHHHRHQRWLLPGGHVEPEDADLAATARREATEETAVRIRPADRGRLAGMDVHGIPARKNEPYHLHHDLIFVSEAESEVVACTEEAPKVAWCADAEFESYELPGSIVRAARRAFTRV